MNTADPTPHSPALSDEQWARIQDLLPGREGQRGRRAQDNRLFVEALLYRQTVGCSWRHMPAHFGDFRSLHIRYSRWLKSGVWQRVLAALEPADAPTARPLDLRLLVGANARIAITDTPRQPLPLTPHHRCFPMVSSLIIGCLGN